MDTMRQLITLGLAVACVYCVNGFCSVSAPDDSHNGTCVTENGTLIDPGTVMTDMAKCMKCTCVASIHGGSALSCCGFGIAAGVFALPGCKVITEADGCTAKIVRIADETQSCFH